MITPLKMAVRARCCVRSCSNLVPIERMRTGWDLQQKVCEIYCPSHDGVLRFGQESSLRGDVALFADTIRQALSGVDDRFCSLTLEKLYLKKNQLQRDSTAT